MELFNLVLQGMNGILEGVDLEVLGFVFGGVGFCFFIFRLTGDELAEGLGGSLQDLLLELCEAFLGALLFVFLCIFLDSLLAFAGLAGAAALRSRGITVGRIVAVCAGAQDA